MRRIAAALLAASALLDAGEAGAQQPASGSAAEDVRRGRPFVVSVVVPLCSNDQIDCGSAAAGRAGSLKTNLYWGAIFGARRLFDKEGSGWERVDVATGDRGPAGHGTSPDGILERVVYRRRVAGAAWAAGGEVEQLVVLEAVHGDRIDRAVDRFWKLATEGGRVAFADGGRAREERVHVAGYAGHNRLMDGKALPARPDPRRPGIRPLPSFVLACHSERYFAEALRAAGSEPLVTTRSLMAPEGYVIDAAARALGDNLAAPEVRDAVVRAYARWQRLSFGRASPLFAPAR